MNSTTDDRPGDLWLYHSDSFDIFACVLRVTGRDDGMLVFRSIVYKNGARADTRYVNFSRKTLHSSKTWEKIS